MSLACSSYRTNAYAKGLNSRVAERLRICSNLMNSRIDIYWDLGGSRRRNKGILGRKNKGFKGSWGLSCNLNRGYSLSG